MAGIFRRRLIAVERKITAIRRLIARYGLREGLGGSGSRQVQGNIGAKPLRDILQLTDHHPEAEDDQAGARRYGTRQNQGVAETELLNRDSETDRQETGQYTANPGDQHHNHHQTHPRAALQLLAGRQCHDTVILRASPTGNCEGGSR